MSLQEGIINMAVGGAASTSEQPPVPPASLDAQAAVPAVESGGPKAVGPAGSTETKADTGTRGPDAQKDFDEKVGDPAEDETQYDRDSRLANAAGFTLVAHTESGRPILDINGKRVEGRGKGQLLSRNQRTEHKADIEAAAAAKEKADAEAAAQTEADKLKDGGASADEGDKSGEDTAAAGGETTEKTESTDADARVAAAEARAKDAEDRVARLEERMKG